MAGLEDIATAAAHLSAGGLVAFPTETVYGLGADASNTDAIERVFRLKGRPRLNPLIVHVSGEEMARATVSAWPEIASRLASTFWPGPLTLVLPKSELIPDTVTAGGSSVAVRMPDHETALALIEAFGGPIVGPSANPSGYVSPTHAAHVAAHFGGETESDRVVVIDGGPCRTGIESTVLDLTGGAPRILRRGVVGATDLASVIGEVEIAESGPESETAASPGMLGPHYQPASPVNLIEDASLLSRLVSESEGKVVLIGPPGQGIRISPPHIGIDMPGLAKGYARALYAALRRADEESPSRIIIVMPLMTDSEIWDAIRERLRRASGSSRDSE